MRINLHSLYRCLSTCLLITIFSCSKSEDGSNLNYKNCIRGKVLYVSCAGVVIQLQPEEKIGETWQNGLSGSDTTHYVNSVLASGVSSQFQKKDSIIYFDYAVTSNRANNTCDIGGLPNSFIEVKNIQSTNCK